ncbi:MAG: hypothetical protein ACRC5M_04490 [Anaeroplasmataceae bacterium]
MNKHDGVIYNQKFNINHIVDERLKDPNTKLKFGNNEFTLAEINNIIPSKEKKLDIFVEWDNMCQYTVFGMLDVINDIIKEKRTIDIYSFLRREDYPLGLDYLKNVIYPDINPQLIDKVIEKFYVDITAKSPVTAFFNKINLMKFMLNSVTFMFRYDAPNLDSFVDEISKDKFDGKVNCKYVIYNSEEMEIAAIKEFSLKEMYVVPDMGLYYKSMIEFDKYNTTILSYRDHNGVNPYILAYYFNEFVYNDIVGPNDIILDFLEEYQKDENDLKEYKKDD